MRTIDEISSSLFHYIQGYTQCRPDLLNELVMAEPEWAAMAKVALEQKRQQRRMEFLLAQDEATLEAIANQEIDIADLAKQNSQPSA
ncbi:MAG: hypothetical protein HQM01_11425 [Magnetococcales bacterium]|nr:hypothetical protein [Magnetococcales bacterium]